MSRARWLAEWRNSEKKPVFYHCISRVVDRRFVLGGDGRGSVDGRIAAADDGNPIADLVEYVRHREPDLIALSITLEAHQAAIIEACRALLEMEATPPILLGGQGARGLDSSALGSELNFRKLYFRVGCLLFQ